MLLFVVSPVVLQCVGNINTACGADVVGVYVHCLFCMCVVASYSVDVDDAVVGCGAVVVVAVVGVCCVGKCGDVDVYDVGVVVVGVVVGGGVDNSVGVGSDGAVVMIVVIVGVYDVGDAVVVVGVGMVLALRVACVVVRFPLSLVRVL